MNEIEQSNEKFNYRVTIIGLLIGLIIITSCMAYIFYSNTGNVITQEQCKKLLESKTGFSCTCYNSSKSLSFGDMPIWDQEQVCNTTQQMPYYNLSSLKLK